MMSNHKKRSVFFGSLFILSMLWAASGCVKDDTTDCSATYLLHVRAYASVGGADVSADVNDVILYVFDNDDLFVEQISTTIGSFVSVSVPKDESVTIVAWGNLSGGHQTCTTFDVGDPVTGGSVELSALARSGMAVKTPDDLFYGSLTLSHNDLKGEKEIPMYRKTGRMNVTIRGLKQYFGFADDDYSVRINSTNRAITFDGKLTTGDVTHYPAGSFNTAGEFTVPSFNLLACQQITVDIFHGNDLLTTVTTSDGTADITVTEGLTTNLLVNYLGSLSVTVNITAWGTETVWKEF